MNYQQLLPNILNFDATSVSAAEKASAAISRLAPITQNTSSFLKTRAMSVILKGNIAGSASQMNFVNMLDELQASEFYSAQYGSFNIYGDAVQTYGQHYREWIGDFDIEQPDHSFQYQVAYLTSGQKQYTILSVFTESENSFQSVMAEGFFDPGDYESWSDMLYEMQDVETAWVKWLPAQGSTTAQFYGHIDPDYSAADVLESYTEMYQNGELFARLLDTCAQQGEISGTSIRNICADYSSQVAADVSSTMAAVDVVSYDTLAAFLLKVLTDNSGDEVDGEFVPYTRPKYYGTVWSIVVSLVATVATTVIPALLFAINAALGAIAFVVMQIANGFKQLWRRATQAVIQRVSETPTFNIPLGDQQQVQLTTDVAIRKWGQFFHDTPTGACVLAVTRYGVEVVDDHSTYPTVGYVVITMGDTPALDSRGWYCNYVMAQVLLSPCQEFVDSDFNNKMRPMGVRYAVENSTTAGVVQLDRFGSSCPGLPQSPSAYVGFDDGQMRHSVLYSIASMLNLLSGVVIDANDWRGSLNYYWRDIPADQAIPRIQGAPLDGTDWRYAYRANLTNYLGHRTQWWNNSGAGDREMNHDFSLLFGPMLASMMYESVSTSETSGWSWAQLYDDLNLFFSGGGATFLNDMLTARLNLDEPWSDGADFVEGSSLLVLNPAVDFPDTSSTAIVGAILALTLSAAAVATVTLSVKRRLTKVANAKLASRQRDFDLAQQQYLSSPTSDNLTALTRANRRLTRAWKFANWAGVSMWNGFSTGDTTGGAISGSGLLSSGVSSPSSGGVSADVALILAKMGFGQQ